MTVEMCDTTVTKVNDYVKETEADLKKMLNDIFTKNIDRPKYARKISPYRRVQM